MNHAVIKRQVFFDQLKLLTNDALHSTRQHGLIVLDIDALRFVNASCGFMAGDYLLGQVSELLAGIIQPGHIVGHMGGGNFAILLPNTEHNDVLELASLALESISQRDFCWQDTLFNITLSAGATLLLDNDGDESVALARAESGLFDAKRQGHNCFRFCDAPEPVDEIAVSGWAPRIHHAFLHDGFHLWYQPVRSADSSQAKLFDISCTCDVDGQAVPLDIFQDELATLGMAVTLDRWLLRRLRDYLTGGQALANHNKFMFTLSADSVKAAEFRRFLVLELVEHPALRSVLVLALPHRELCEDAATMHDFITEFKNLGVTMALAGYGAGVDSLLQLRELAVDYVRPCAELFDSAAAGNTDTISVLAALIRSEGKQAIAMGANTERDLKTLREAGYALALGELSPKIRWH